VLALGREPVDRRVAVAVRHVDLAVLRHGDVGRMVERRLQRRPSTLAERQDDAPLGRELQDLVLVAVAGIDVVIRPDVDPVGIAQTPVAPAVHEVAVAVEHQDRRVLPLIEVDAILRVDGDVADEAEAPARRQHAPRAENVVDEVSGPTDESGRAVRHPGTLTPT
jgi:hypothetical protein